MRARRFVRSNSAILLVTCAIALAQAEAREERRGAERHIRATNGDLERHAVRKYSRVYGLATAAIRDDGDHLKNHCAGIRRYAMHP
jgi:hypothetical protein